MSRRNRIGLLGIVLAVLLTFQGLPLERFGARRNLWQGLRSRFRLGVAEAAWVSGYTYRKKITLSHSNSTGAGTDYQVSLSIGDSTGGDFHLEGHCSSFPTDIRFTDNDGTAPLKYWIEDTSADPITVWVKVTDSLESSNVDIYVYYGKSGDTSDSNGTNTFEFFDDFDSYTDGDLNGQGGWSGSSIFDVQSTIAQSGKAIRGDASNHYYISRVTDDFNSGIVTFYMRLEGNMNSPYSLVRFYEGATIKLDMMLFNPFRYLDSGGANSNLPISTAAAANTWYKVEIAFDASTNKYESIKIDDVEKTSGGVASLAFTKINKIELCYINGGAGATHYDNFRVRKYAATEPAFSSAWAEQVADRIYSYRKAITIDNTSGGALTNYQVQVSDPIYDEDDLVGSWHFEEASVMNGGTVADSSGQGKTGTYTTDNAATEKSTASGKHDRGLTFDGTGDYVDCGTDSSLDITGNQLTMEAWVYPTAWNGNDYVLSKYAVAGGTGGYGMALTDEAGGQITYFIDTGGATSQKFSSVTKEMNKWHHFVVTYDGSHLTSYWNGVLKDSHSQTGNIDTTTNTARIGRLGTGAYYFSGTIDEVRIYNRALSAAEIAAHYAAKAKTNYGDVRFTDSTDWTGSDWGSSYPYWMENDGTFWVKVDSIPASSTKTIYIYYGNSSASSASNGTNTFIVFDDFERGSNGDVIGGDWSIYRGDVDISTDHSYGGTRSMKLFGCVAQSIALLTVSPSDNKAVRFRAWKEDGSHSIFFYEGDDHASYIDLSTVEDISYYDVALQDTGHDTTADAWHLFEWNDFDWTGFTHDILYDGTLIANDVGMWADSTYVNKLFLAEYDATGIDTYIDDVIIRKYASPEPTTSVGGEEGGRPQLLFVF